jgi:hypothetical protein
MSNMNLLKITVKLVCQLIEKILDNNFIAPQKCWDQKFSIIGV